MYTCTLHKYCISNDVKLSLIFHDVLLFLPFKFFPIKWIASTYDHSKMKCIVDYEEKMQILLVYNWHQSLIDESALVLGLFLQVWPSRENKSAQLLIAAAAEFLAWPVKTPTRWNERVWMRGVALYHHRTILGLLLLLLRAPFVAESPSCLISYPRLERALKIAQKTSRRSTGTCIINSSPQD